MLNRNSPNVTENGINNNREQTRVVHLLGLAAMEAQHRMECMLTEALVIDWYYLFIYRVGVRGGGYGSKSQVTSNRKEDQNQNYLFLRYPVQEAHLARHNSMPQQTIELAHHNVCIYCLKLRMRPSVGLVYFHQLGVHVHNAKSTILPF